MVKPTGDTVLNKIVPHTSGAYLEAGERDINKSLRYNTEELNNNTPCSKYNGGIVKRRN